MKLKDRVGQKYSYLTVLKKSDVQRLPNKVLWDCQCICGKIIKVSSGNLTRGQQSCGCMRHAIAPNKSNDRVVAIQKYVFQRNVQGTAKQRGIPVEIDFETFAELSIKPCYYCGCEPNKRVEDKRHGNKRQRRRVSDTTIYYNGLDRIDNSRGYTADNVVPCCTQCNYSKRTMSMEDFREWAKRLYNNFCIDTNLDAVNG